MVSTLAAQPLKWALFLGVVLICAWELPRDLAILGIDPPPGLRLGLSIKMSTGLLGVLLLSRKWVAGWALLLLWCLQGLLMSYGEWLGEGVSPSFWVSVPFRLSLLGLIFCQRVLGKEVLRL